MGLIARIKNHDNKKAIKELEKIALKVEELSDVYKAKTDDELVELRKDKRYEELFK